ncbi:MAG: sortase [Ruminococcus sp.]|nr:sortase [Ruminococcus sp.]
METTTTEPNSKKRPMTTGQRIMFIVGVLAMSAGISILGFFGCRKIWREYCKYQLMKNNPVIEIADIHIKAPILEGTGQDILAKAAGHFENTGDFGKGNYCIAGHSSVLYKEYFNNLKRAEKGMEIVLYDTEKTPYSYIISDISIVEPSDTWILDDFGDNRVTIVTCTDDGTQRLIVTGLLK